MVQWAQGDFFPRGELVFQNIFASPFCLYISVATVLNTTVFWVNDDFIYVCVDLIYSIQNLGCFWCAFQNTLLKKVQ